MIDPGAIRRVPYGHFTLADPGGGPRRPVVVCGYLISHPAGPVLFDTGIGEGDPEAEERFRPVRRRLREALREAGAEPGDVRLVVNCHLHADHAGGNPAFPATPILVQRIEHEAARAPGYTIPALLDFEGARYERVDGEAEVLPGVRVVPTPGHTDGHQSLVVETTAGRYVLAGQAVNFATDYATARLSWDLRRHGDEGAEHPAWIARLEELDPRRVLFAHDLAIWDERPLEP